MFSSNYDLLSTSFNKQVSSKGTAALNNQSIINRAIEIGMDPLKDQKLFWIAEQSLKAKLPEEWIECQTDEGQVYFYNLRNEDSTWEHPSLDHYRGLYEKVKKQQTESQSSNKKMTNLPEIGTKDPQHQSPRAAVGAVGLAAVALGTAESVSSPVTPSATPAAPGGGRLLNGGGSGIVAASALKQKKDAERLGGDVSFWRTRFELMEAEKDKINNQVRKLEQDLQSNLLQGARLIEENHRLKNLLQDSASKLKVASDGILKHLAKRGFKNDPRQGAGDADLSSSVEDLLRVIRAHVEIDEGDRDESGFSVNWDGALARIKREFDFSFTYEGESYSVDSVELKVKLEDVIQMAISYGEYLSPDDREGYVDLFLEHLLRAAKDSTLVPLEMISKAGVKSITHPGRADVLLDSPLTVNSLRKELIEEKALSKSLGLELDQRKHEMEVLHMKITGLQSRLEDNRSHEELLTAKFNSLNKSIEDIRLANEITKEKTTLAEKIQQVNKLKSEIQTLNNQLNIANKRATDSERRLQDSLSREMKLKADLSSTEMALQLKLDRKRVHLSELLEQKKDLEQVSQELYGELQNALLLTTRLETDNSALQDLIDEYRAGDACVPALHEKLAMEQERSMKLKEQVIALKGDVSSLRHGYEELESELERRERGYVELQEDYAGLSYEFQKLTNRSELLTKDNLSLESQGRALRGQVMQLNETIVEIKGSLLVYCRVRPLFVEEMRALNLREEDVLALIQYPDYNLLDYNGIPYEFHRVFEPTADQGEVFAEVEAHVRSVVNGTRLCLFMYGITSSGKTHTMEGTEADPGLLHRSLQTLLQLTSPSSSEGFHTDITLSLLEIYNEKIRDLLSLEKEQEHPDFSLEIKVSGTGTYVDGLSEWPIRCYEEAQSLFKRAHACRHSLASASSSTSSSSSRLIRSHFIVLIKVHRTKMSTGHTTTGQLYFVDLAGSERMKLGDATGGQLREAQSINKSLTALGDVMAGLAAKHKHKHIPYRNSKLTFLLQDVLRESARILMFINLTPSPVHTGESVASLQFGAKCRSVHLGHPKKLITHYPNNR